MNRKAARAHLDKLKVEGDATTAKLKADHAKAKAAYDAWCAPQLEFHRASLAMHNESMRLEQVIGEGEVQLRNDALTLTQPALARQLRDNRLNALESGQPELIVTANVGCQNHLDGAGRTPVRHWIELVDQSLAE